METKTENLPHAGCATDATKDPERQTRHERQTRLGSAKSGGMVKNVRMLLIGCNSSSSTHISQMGLPGCLFHRTVRNPFLFTLQVRHQLIDRFELRR